MKQVFFEGIWQLLVIPSLSRRAQNMYNTIKGTKYVQQRQRGLLLTTVMTQQQKRVGKCTPSSLIFGGYSYLWEFFSEFTQETGGQL